jgi:hypothetical protein
MDIWALGHLETNILTARLMQSRSSEYSLYCRPQAGPLSEIHSTITQMPFTLGHPGIPGLLWASSYPIPAPLQTHLLSPYLALYHFGTSKTCLTSSLHLLNLSLMFFGQPPDHFCSSLPLPSSPCCSIHFGTPKTCPKSSFHLLNPSPRLLGQAPSHFYSSCP